MKTKTRYLFYFSLFLTIIGFLLDNDPKEPSTIMRFIEFFGMLSMLFILSYSIFFFTEFIRRQCITIRS
ncbi:hypothetical protein [Haloflavibacter putidus]|uniref:Uncharacterized protein n=1 Tax=Haloflavibacter putidus TaxID=2576776 RepID=A0A507ZQP4_9FLAO|nr:hypothetical protein [Haloflavibacter putidus]TQD38584.1 hypothetical protein FKR84_09190 [Haloflavibacter putidus]